MNGLWTQGEPEKSGYYLVLVRDRALPEGNPWVFLARVVVDQRDVPPEEWVNYGRPVYMDHHSGDNKWRAYPGGHVVAHCLPTPENFAAALEEIKDFYNDEGTAESP